jgi:hypothetical protein
LGFAFGLGIDCYLTEDEAKVKVEKITQKPSFKFQTPADTPDTPMFLNTKPMHPQNFFQNFYQTISKSPSLQGFSIPKTGHTSQEGLS